MPPAILLLFVGGGKLVFDIFDKDFRPAANTLVILGLAVSFIIVGMLSDLLVQLNRRRHDVVPATLGGRSRRV